MGQTWKEFCAGINKVAGKAAVKLETFSDNAAKYVKEKSLDVKLCEAYEKLGRLYYAQMNGQTGQTDKINACVEEIDQLRQQMSELKQKREADAQDDSDEEEEQQ